ncbi:hypothetical protein AMTR_s00008p00112010 [Amborella trichopoda]|uniref:Uncharacterized protein n=1 Tax=Amborella trichopoda TaxID=13333 RepID=W1NHN1_AMBTC|nr:hypothetical protein AMTR_s00008p00112010 [Amborella trichopoda]
MDCLAARHQIDSIGEIMVLKIFCPFKNGRIELMAGLQRSDPLRWNDIYNLYPKTHPPHRLSRSGHPLPPHSKPFPSSIPKPNPSTETLQQNTYAQAVARPKRKPGSIEVPLVNLSHSSSPFT